MMIRSMLGAFLGAVALVVIVGCGSEGNSALQPGDTVTPALAETVKLTAGQDANLSVRLQAQGETDKSPRSLGFISGVSANPTATITYYEGDQPIGTPTEVVLSHRC